MKFGKEFRIHLEETPPEWRDKYLCYKPLKKLLKKLPNAAAADDDDDHVHRQQPAGEGPSQALPPMPPPALPDLEDWFVGILNEELEKFNDFYVDKEEEFVIRFQELKERIEQVKEKSCKNGVFTSESEFSHELMAIRRDFVTIHGEMVLLKNYSSLNFAGILKILKKYDKRTGGLLRLHFTELTLRQPFFTTEPLTRLVHECEENLELLFPSEAEVVESTSSAAASQEKTNSAPDDHAANMSSETSDVYRMTLAAMRTITGLKKASSTSNPLSFSSIFGGGQDSDTGAITAEDSPDNSS